MASRIKRDDHVVVISGKDKGKTGEIEKVDPKAGKAVVGGLNIAIRPQRQSQSNQGGRIAILAVLVLELVIQPDEAAHGALDLVLRFGFGTLAGVVARAAR